MSTLFSCAPARHKLDHQSDTDLYVLFSFIPPAIEGADRAPLDISVAMDVSGSMTGQKIDTARTSLLKLVEHLSDKDHLSVVSFSTNVDVLFPRSEMTLTAKSDAAKTVRELKALRSTNLSGGILQSLAILREQNERSTVRRVLVFTDGLPNMGIVGDELSTTVTEFRCGIGVSTFGIGVDHDPVLLNKLAQDGSFYYISGPDQILTAFGQELGGLISTYAQNVRLTLTPKEGVEIIEILNDLKVDDLGEGKAGIACDDLLAEQPYHVVAKLKVGKRDNAHPREVAILTADVSYFDLVLKKIVTETATLKVRFVKPGVEDTQDETKAAEVIGLQLIGKASREAEKLAAVEDFASARAQYVTASAYISEIHSEKGNALGMMAREIGETAYRDKGTWRGGGSHTSNAIARGASRQRAALAGTHFGSVDFDGLVGSKAQAEMAHSFQQPESTPPLTVIPPPFGTSPGSPIPPPNPGFVKLRSDRS